MTGFEIPPPDHAMHARSTDADHSLSITRTIPLSWLISVGIAVVVQAALIWQGQEKQSDAILRMTAQLVEQTKQIQSLSVEIGAKNLKDVEHDLKLADHDRRISTLEGGRK